MTIRDYRKALELIEEHGGGDFEGPKPESLVAKAEATLGLTFPPTYRLFLRELGCGDINGVEVLGVVDDDFENSSVPDGVWLTLTERRAIGLNPAYILVGEGADGTYLALDTHRLDDAGEAPVVRLAVDGTPFETVANSFGAYLLNAMQNSM